MSRHVAICATCGKRSFETRSAARSAAHADGITGQRMNAYRCGDLWHLGHLPAAVKAGNATRADIGRGVLPLAVAQKRRTTALRAFILNPADGLAWLRAIAAREALERSMARHPAGRRPAA